MIQDVETKALKVVPDDRGRLMEILRIDDGIYKGFGQVYMTTAYPGVVKAWHFHEKQWDHMTCIRGMMKLALYDGREGSPTRGEVNEFFVGDHRPLLVRIPPRVHHGFKCVSDHEAVIINTVTEVYHYAKPDEFRLDPHANEIPYHWDRKDG
jgi:dTDP-4-dehydrorhamnose 3,5-epimerase